MNCKNLATAVLIVGIPSSLVAAPAKNKADAINQFASGLGTLAKKSDVHNPLEVQKLLKVRLKNPDKWLGQPDGTSRRARWRSPVNELGITDVVFNDNAVGANTENSDIHQDVVFHADFVLSGNPCVRVSDIERGVGKRAEVSNIFTLAFHYHPQLGSPRHIPPDKRISFIIVRNKDGYDVTISGRADRLGPSGCLRTIGLQATRPSMLSLRD